VNLNRGKAVHYPCRPENGFVPDPEEIARLVTKRTRAIVVINPNNPTGAVYPREVLEQIVQLAERNGLVIFSDEIYDQMLYDGAEFCPLAPLVRDTVCVTLSGLSKVYRACGYRVGWAVVSGRLRAAGAYLEALDLLSSLRLCSNVPAQWAVQTALGGYQSVRELVSPGGRLYESRRAILDSVERSRFLRLKPPAGAMYAFIGVDTRDLPDFDDQQFALDLLEQKHVLVAPGVSFNVPYRTHFRVTNLPDSEVLRKVFARVEELLEGYAAGKSEPTAGVVLEAQQRFK
jgi:alanine-synthesizing transaminase